MQNIAILLCGLWLSFPAFALIGGSGTSEFPEVVRLQAGKRICTGTIIGPRVIVSAAHCATSDSPFFMHNGTKYAVRYLKSSAATEQGHDLALAVTEKPIGGAVFARLGQGLKHGMKILLAGFGCTKRGGQPGALHVGITNVVGVDEDHVLSASKGGGVLCEGDSGGPAFISDGVRRVLVAVSSLSDIRKININVRLDSALTRAFFKTAARVHHLEICGVTSICE